MPVITQRITVEIPNQKWSYADKAWDMELNETEVVEMYSECRFLKFKNGIQIDYSYNPY